MAEKGNVVDSFDRKGRRHFLVMIRFWSITVKPNRYKCLENRFEKTYLGSDKNIHDIDLSRSIDTFSITLKK